MFLRVGKMLLVVALVTTLGAHWALLQTVAWTTMLAGNLGSGSFCDAVTKTFDGKHPCCLCRAIAAGKKSEKNSELTARNLRFEFPLTKANPVPVAPTSFDLFPQENSFAEALSQEPQTPPPRSFFA